MPDLEVFDKHVRQYEEWFAANPFAYVSELHAVQELLPLTGNGLDIGVGTGRFAFPLGIRTGVEPSPAMAELSKKKGIDVFYGVAENLPFPGSTFDFCLMVTTICFLDDLDLAIQEAFRVLKPHSPFIIGFVDKNSVLGKAYEEKKRDSLFYRNATFYSVDELLPRLRSAGFTTFNFRQTLFLPLETMEGPSQIKTGYGEGSFVVIKAGKE